MELRILLSIAAIYMALVGLGFIFAPQAIGIGAVPTAASAALIAYLRLFGSPFVGIAVMNSTARHAPHVRPCGFTEGWVCEAACV